MKKFIYLNIIFVLLLSCNSNDEITICPEEFVIDNEISIKEINVYYEDIKYKTYYINNENKISEIHFIGYPNDENGTNKKHIYTYNSCGALDMIEDYYIGTNQYKGIVIKYVYDNNGNLEKEIIGSFLSPVLHLFIHNETDNSVILKEYRRYDVNTGEYSLFNYEEIRKFDEFDNSLDFVLDNSYLVFDDNYNVLSDDISYHTEKNPFFLILNKTTGRKIFFLDTYDPEGRYFFRPEFGFTKNFLIYTPDPSLYDEVIINNSYNGYATSFQLGKYRYEVILN